MTKFGDYEVALRMRQTIADIASEVVERVRPAYRYATVMTINRLASTATVQFPGETTSVRVGMGAIQPNVVGQKVRIHGLPGERYIADVNGLAYSNMNATIVDSRTVNSPPSFYVRSQTWEFKEANKVGIDASVAGNNSGFVTIQTIAGWSDESGGGKTQIAHVRQAGNVGTNPYWVGHPDTINGLSVPRTLRRMSNTGSADTWGNWYYDAPPTEISGTQHINSSNGGLNRSWPAGFYESPPGTSNSPSGDWHIIRIERHTNTNGNSYIQQYAQNMFTNKQYIRSCNGGDPTNAGSWTYWKQIDEGLNYPTGWQTATMLNGWVHYGEPFGPVQYRLETSGTVFIRGLASPGGVNGNRHFTLPTELRPQRNNIYVNWSSSGPFEMRVDTDGGVYGYGVQGVAWASMTATFHRGT